MTWSLLYIAASGTALWKNFAKAWAWLLIEMLVKLLSEVCNLPCTLRYFYITFSRSEKCAPSVGRRVGKKNMVEILSPYSATLTCQFPPCWISWQMKKHVVHSWKLQRNQGWRVFFWKINRNLKWTPRRAHVVAAEEQSEETAPGSPKHTINNSNWRIS